MSTKERILDAALDLFAEAGVDATTVTAIERRAGLAGGSGSLYRHFRSKEDVLDATIEREVTRLKELLEHERAARPRLPDRRSQLLLQFHQTLRDIKQFDRLLRILQRETGRSPSLQGIVARVVGLDRGLASWSSHDDRLDPMTAVVVVAALVGYHAIGQWQDRPFLDVDADAFIERLVDLVEPQG